MKIKLLSFLFSFFLMLIFSNKTDAQFVNNGTTIFISAGGNVFVDGDFYNQSGSIIDLGDLTLKGNWLNDDNKGAFNIASSGNVSFTGANQTIGGTQTTIFPNVILSGTGIKKLLINTSVNGTLNLNDRELAADSKNLFLLSNNPNTISLTSGFISTDNRGFLYRNTNSQSAYLFPLGSKLTGTLVYRPVSTKVKDNSNNTFGVNFTDKDPSSEGYNRNSKRFDVNEINPLYFHLLDQRTGNSPADFTFYYNNPGDGNFNQLVDWIKFNLWEKAGIANPQPFIGGNAQLNQLMTYSSLQTISSLPIALSSIVSNNDPLTFFNSFTPDGDGINDRWEIKNIDLFPDNDLTILNRWGSEVLKVKGYNNANAWDGLGLNNGTYFYILKVNVNGEFKVYKGFITLLKK
jgi:gliding motility-associated-like protein